MPHIRLSMLDRANAKRGASAGEALSAVISRAERLERLGYHRIWVAEHHGVPGILGSAPTLLMAAIAGATERIRVGSGGVMLPAHQPLVVAEQIATLEAIYPGRIDIGLGRSLGFTPGVRDALRQDHDADQRFFEDLTELQAFLSGSGTITMQPPNDAATPLYLLAHGESLEFAARAGLGVVIGGSSLRNTTPGTTHEGLDRYRRDFRPSRWFAEPAVIISARVAVADTESDARNLLLPEAWALALSRSTGAFDPLHPTSDLDFDRLTDRERERVERNVRNSIAGTPDSVAERIHELVRFTGATELLATGGMFDSAGQEHSDALLAELIR